MLFALLFLSCKEDIKYASSDPSNCTAEFCEEDFEEGSGSTQDTGTSSTDDELEDTADETDTSDFENSDNSNDDPQDPEDGSQGDSENLDGEDDTGYEHEDSGFHKESEECGCANPEGSLSFFLFFSFFGLWRRKPSHRPA